MQSVVVVDVQPHVERGDGVEALRPGDEVFVGLGETAGEHEPLAVDQERAVDRLLASRAEEPTFDLGEVVELELDSPSLDWIWKPGPKIVSVSNRPGAVGMLYRPLGGLLKGPR